MADNKRDKVWSLIKDNPICMLTTHDGEKLRSRPMGAYPRPAEDAIYCLTDVHGFKDNQVEANPHVSLAFVDGTKSYVAVAGNATVSNDRAKIRELWSKVAEAWWDGPDDPDIRLLRITPLEAEYWQGPGKVVAYASMLAAAVTDARPKVGESHKVDM